ncbi:hypothetical protein AB0N99_21205 [Streptomyces sp. NPDC093272]|uniref:hypothetical protein n=1 Tax=Streptomyces sp. NPDC093272 TaxID=3154981 RepID=UPI00343B3F61
MAPAISVGSVEVDVIPNAQGVRQRMQQQLLPAADSVGEELGRVMGRFVAQGIANGVAAGITAGGRQAQAPATRQGQSTGSTFARSLKATLEAGLARLPEIRLRADSSDAERELYQIRNQMRALADARIGIDVSAETANAAIDQLRERLARLSASDADIAVRVDSGAAAAQLAAFQAQVNRLDGQQADVDVDVDTSSAQANLGALTSAGLALGPAIIPAALAAAAAIGSIVGAAAAAAAGVGAVGLVAVPAFKEIGNVLSLQKTAQDAASRSTAAGGQAAAQASSKALQLAGAQQAVATAARNGARQIAQAEQQVTQARQNASQVASQAAQRTAQAARQVQDAERAVTDAQKAATKAQQDLTAARTAATRELQDMNNSLKDAQLAQTQAELDLADAKKQRDAVFKNSASTAEDKARAQLQYDQAVQSLKEQQIQTARLAKDTAAANKAGVKGSATYKTAQDQLAQAQAQVADKTQALKDAQDAQARTAEQNAQDIAAAQQRIADAQSNVAQAQQSAADSAASAQRQLASAQQSTAGATDQAATAQDNYRKALAALTPEARGLLVAYTGLRGAFSAWSRSLQPAVLPLFTRGVVAARKALPGLTPFVYAAADALGVLEDRAAKGFKSTWWSTFVSDLQHSVKPAIIGLGTAFGNVFKGIVLIVDAFLPHMDSISSTLQRITGKFATWAQGLRGSPAFEKFLSYSADKGPVVAHVLGQIVSAALAIGKAIAPVATPLLKIVGGTAAVLGNIATYLPELVIGMYALAVATKLWAAYQWLANIAATAFNIIMDAGPWAIIVVAIVAVTLAVLYLYRRFAWFRTAVQAVWNGIKTGAMWLWNNALKPAFGYIWEGLQQLGRIAMWLWEKAIKPAWDAISIAARILLTIIVITVFLPIIAVFKRLGHAASELWSTVLKPVFGWIGDLAVWLWNKAIKPQFAALVSGFKTVGKWAGWLYDHAIKPAWDNIVKAGKWAYDKGIKPIFDGWKLVLKGLGGVFGDAVDAIKSQWDKVKGVAKTPVKFIVDTVYNNGIVGVWNKVAKAFGAPELHKFKFASGGIMPGYTPGRDVHQFVSPTGGRLDLSGGEAIMRPEFTKAVGSGWVNSFNALARTRGAQGVKAALAPVFGGNPMTHTDTTLRYKDGGIFGWIGSAASKVAGAGSSAWNAVKHGASWLADTLEASARAGVKHVVDPILKGFPGMDTGFGKLVRHIPDKILDALFGYSKKADDKGAGGIGGPKIQAALRWAKSQAGKPYIWGGVGPAGFDCSGFMGAIENVIRGLKPNSRRWATGAFSGKTAPPGWVYHGNSAFRIGITNAGVGHTAGTLGKTNVESRGGAGVIVGAGARGYNDRLFQNWYGFQPGKYDNGGLLQPGMNLAFNGTGAPEPVFTSSQFDAIHGAAMANQSQQPVVVELHPQEGAFGHWVDVRIQDSQQQLVQVLNAG